MQDTRTRTFTSNPTYKSGKRDNLRIKMYPRVIISMGLAMSLATTSFIGYKITQKPTKTYVDNNKESVAYEEKSDYQKDVDAIAKIIEDKGESMLITRERISYPIKTEQDVLSIIAEKYGTTVKRLMELNKGKVTSKGGTFLGSVIEVDAAVDLSEEDKQINMLDAYVFDYLLRDSTFARIALGEEGEFEEQQSLYNFALYGKSEEEHSIDPSSINGQAIKANAIYNESGKTLENKEKYIEIMNNIVKAANIEINNVGGYVLPYEDVQTAFLSGSVSELNHENTI